MSLLVLSYILLKVILVHMYSTDIWWLLQSSPSLGYWRITLRSATVRAGASPWQVTEKVQTWRNVVTLQSSSLSAQRNFKLVVVGAGTGGCGTVNKFANKFGEGEVCVIGEIVGVAWDKGDINNVAYLRPGRWALLPTDVDLSRWESFYNEHFKT